MFATLSISYEAKRGFFMAKIFGYHVSCIEDFPADIEGGEFFF